MAITTKTIPALTPTTTAVASDVLVLETAAGTRKISTENFAKFAVAGSIYSTFTYGNIGQTLTDGVTTLVMQNITGNTTSYSSGIYTCPIDGTLFITGLLTYTVQSVILALYLNGVSTLFMSNAGAVRSQLIANLTVNQGDSIEIKPEGDTRTLLNSSTTKNHYIQYTLIPS